jgi:hypothetical protein
MPLGLVAVVGLATAASGCRSDCSQIKAGTPATDLPLEGNAIYSLQYCQFGQGDELDTLACCHFAPTLPDGGANPSCRHGSFDCTNVGPAEPVNIGGSYSGWECAEYTNDTEYCVAWIRDQQVIGTCGGCPPD